MPKPSPSGQKFSVMGNSLRDIAQSNDTSVNQIRQDLKCGMAYIKSRNPHFRFETFEKTA
ncbi:hypothetical protein [Acinetobacter baumannii]|uniref:hypothetical protein n=1 Tax=Acinetobacter baumannii TaxID=470 RepID=UPI00215DF438|nr:hypothetical protein [Acinetobacter baumannii]